MSLVKISEIYIAKKALELAKNEKNNEKNKNVKKEHIGYYLISERKKRINAKITTKYFK